VWTPTFWANTQRFKEALKVPKRCLIKMPLSLKNPRGRLIIRVSGIGLIILLYELLNH